MNAVVSVEHTRPLAAPSLSPTSLDAAMRLAQMMSDAKLVPSHLQGKPADCLMVIEQAVRWGMSLFAVAQSTSVIQGKLMFEGKLVAAAINASGVLSDRLSFEHGGEGQGRFVIVRGTIRGEAKARDVKVTLADAKTANGMWTKQPDQQLVYSGARVWARRHVPEIMLGVYAPEEFDEVRQNQATPPPAPQSGPRRAPPPPQISGPSFDQAGYLAKLEAAFDASATVEALNEASESGRDGYGRCDEAGQKLARQLKARAAKRIAEAQKAADAEDDPEDVLTVLSDTMSGATHEDHVHEAWGQLEESIYRLPLPAQQKARALYDQHVARFEPAEAATA